MQKKLFTQVFIYFSKPLRLLYSLIIYEIVNFSFFALYSLLLLSFFLYLKSVPIYVIVHVQIPYSCGTKECATADSTVSAWLSLINAVQHIRSWYHRFIIVYSTV